MSVKKKSFFIAAFFLAGVLVCIFGRTFFRVQGQSGLGKSALYPAMDENGIFQIASIKDFEEFQYYVGKGYTKLNGELFSAANNSVQEMIEGFGFSYENR